MRNQAKAVLGFFLIHVVFGGIFDRDFAQFPPYAAAPVFGDAEIPAEIEAPKETDEVEKSELRMPGVTLTTVGFLCYTFMQIYTFQNETYLCSSFPLDLTDTHYLCKFPRYFLVPFLKNRNPFFEKFTFLSIFSIAFSIKMTRLRRALFCFRDFLFWHDFPLRTS